MVGQHMFMRCWDERGSAGTWTAAVSTDLLERTVIREQLEPCCNLEEVFAQQNMLACSTNNILRIHSLPNGAVVVSRTYWESDRITGSSGRKGAYTVSFVLTDGDVDAYCGDFAGAFDESCFESYASVVERMEAEGTRRVTLDPRYDIFRHKDIKAEFSVFQEAGFDEISFVQLMEGLYAAMERSGKLAVVLPTRVHKAWQETGDDLTERLMMAVMALLPPKTRRKVGMVSHWGCAMREDMLRDMHLVFVHPANEEELRELHTKGVSVLALGADMGAKNIPDAAQNYFSYLWKTIHEPECREAVWRFSEEECGDVIERMPGKASAVESVFLLKKMGEEQYADSELCKAAYVAASGIFAGAGNRFPSVDEALCRCLEEGSMEAAQCDAALVRAMLRFVAHDPTATKHQRLEYDHLFRLIDEGKASLELLDTLPHELEKKTRGAEEYFADYFLRREDCGAKDITSAMMRFVADVFSVTNKLDEKRVEDVLGMSLSAMNRWAYHLEAEGQWDALMPIIDIYAGYLEKKQTDDGALRLCYTLLFRGNLSGSGEVKEQCEQKLIKEERRLYKMPELSTEQGTERLALFCQTMIDVISESGAAHSRVGENDYKRLYRLLGYGRRECDGLMELYSRLADGQHKAEGNLSESSAVLVCQREAVRDMRGAGAIWSEENIQKSTVAIEEILLNTDLQYCPSAQRLAFLLDAFGTWDWPVFSLFLQYFRRTSESARSEIYRTLEEKGCINKLYVYTALDPEAAQYEAEIEAYVPSGESERLQMLLETKILDDNDERKESFKKAFSLRYEKLLDKRLEGRDELLQRLSAFQTEYAALEKIRSDPNEFLAEAMSTLGRTVRKDLLKVRGEQVVEMPKKAVAAMQRLISMQESPEGIEIAPLVRVIGELDSMDEGRVTYQLDAFCTTRECEAQRDYVIARLNYYIRHYQSMEDGMDVAWKYELFRALLFDKGRSFVTNISMGEMELTYSQMSARAKVELMLDMMESLDYRRSNCQRRVFRNALDEIWRVAGKKKEILSSAEVKERLAQLQYLSADDNRVIRRIFGSAFEKREEPTFDFITVILCVLGTLIASSAFIGTLFLLYFFNQFGTMVAILCGGILVVLLLFVFILLCKTKRSDNGMYQGGYY